MLQQIPNTVSLLNPYYKEFGINKMLKKDTKFLRGDGWVFERTYNKNASIAYKESGIARAFKHASYNEYASENKYLNDNECLIGKPTGQSRYICTIRFNEKMITELVAYDEMVSILKKHKLNIGIALCDAMVALRKMKKYIKKYPKIRQYRRRWLVKLVFADEIPFKKKIKSIIKSLI